MGGLRKKNNTTPVIFLTGENGEVQNVRALEMGGDDYITKPFGFPELVARIHAVWGLHADVRSRSLDQYIVKIRDLYKRHDLSLDAFHTVHGVGYIYDVKELE